MVGDHACLMLAHVPSVELERRHACPCHLQAIPSEHGHERDGRRQRSLRDRDTQVGDKALCCFRADVGSKHGDTNAILRVCVWGVCTRSGECRCTKPAMLSRGAVPATFASTSSHAHSFPAAAAAPKGPVWRCMAASASAGMPLPTVCSDDTRRSSAINCLARVAAAAAAASPASSRAVCAAAVCIKVS